MNKEEYEAALRSIEDNWTEEENDDWNNAYLKRLGSVGLFLSSIRKKDFYLQAPRAVMTQPRPWHGTWYISSCALQHPQEETETMKKLLATAAILLSIGTYAMAQEHNCTDNSTCNSADINKGETSNSQTIGDNLDNTYAQDSAFATGGASSVKIGDTIAQGGTGGNANANGNSSSNDNKSSASNNLANQQFGNSSATTGASTSSANNSGGNSTNNIGIGNSQGQGQSIGDTTSIATGGQGGKGGDGGSVKDSGNSASISGATGGTVKDSGNSSNKNSNKQGQSQGQGQSQTAKSSSKSGVSGSGNSSNAQQSNQSSNTQVGGQNTAIDNRNQSSYTYKEAANTAYAAGIYGDSTAPCVKVSGIGAGVQTIGAGWTFNVRNDRESGNCITNQRVAIMSQLYGADGAALYLAQQDPAAQAVIATIGLPSGRPVVIDRSKPAGRNPLGQSTFAQPLLQLAPVEAVCRVKPGTTKTVVTNWPDQKACARQLGLLR